MSEKDVSLKRRDRGKIFLPRKTRRENGGAGKLVSPGAGPADRLPDGVVVGVERTDADMVLLHHDDDLGLEEEQVGETGLRRGGKVWLRRGGGVWLRRGGGQVGSFHFGVQVDPFRLGGQVVGKMSEKPILSVLRPGL